MITNETNIHPAIYAAILKAMGEYNRGHADISVTDIIAPPRMVTLKEKHKEELSEDAADMGARLVGTLVHSAVEKEKVTEEAEKRIYITVDGWVVGGKPDIFDPETGQLGDVKTIKAAEFMYGLKAEREQQLNVYAEMLRLNGYSVSGLTAHLVIVDFNAAAQERDRRYPPRSIVEIPITLWPTGKAQRFIKDRMALHQKARTELPNCTDEERWKRDTYAVKSEGRKNALRVLDTEIEAEEWGIENGVAVMGEGGVSWNSGISLEARPGKPTRCLRYCSVAPFCAQFLGESR